MKGTYTSQPNLLFGTPRLLTSPQFNLRNFQLALLLLRPTRPITNDIRPTDSPHRCRAPFLGRCRHRYLALAATAAPATSAATARVAASLAVVAAVGRRLQLLEAHRSMASPGMVDIVGGRQRHLNRGAFDVFGGFLFPGRRGGGR